MGRGTPEVGREDVGIPVDAARRVLRGYSMAEQPAAKMAKNGFSGGNHQLAPRKNPKEDMGKSKARPKASAAKPPAPSP
jgi:hypothetical protein